MEIVRISSDYIKLDQFLKWANIVNSGVEAKFLIQEGLVTLNGDIEKKRGKKVYNDDIVKIENKEYKVKKS